VAQELTIVRPDDWHLHVRDGAALRAVVPHSARQFGRAIVMPNLRPPVVTVAQALAYRERIVAAVPAGRAFEPLMTLYLTDTTPPAEMARARAAGIVAIKLYPAGATTHSDAGVTDLRKVTATLAAAEREGIVLLIHGEVTDPAVDARSRGGVHRSASRFAAARLPGLRIVLEHVTTKEARSRRAPPRTGATITAHHLLYNRNALFTAGLRPHYYCLPVLSAGARRALVAAATSGSERFFSATDSAPHPAALKEYARAAPAATPRSARSSCTPRRSRPRVRSIASSTSRAAPAPRSTAWRRTPGPSPCASSPGPCPRRSRSARPS
jgi:dihydroorotase